MIFVSTLFASTITDETVRLYKKIPFATKVGTAKILHDLENLYIESVIAGDRKATEGALKGMIRCKHLLNRDASTYEKEYKFLLSSDKKMQKELPKVTSKPSVEKRVVKTKTKSETIQPPMLVNMQVNSDEIIFRFNKKMKYTDVIFFELNSKSAQKDIYDIKAILARGARKSIKINGLDRAVISQNSKAKIRLVLQDKQIVKSSAYIKDKNLIIHIESKQIKKKVKKPVITVQKSQKQHDKKLYKKTYKKIARQTKSILIDPGHGGKDSGAVGCCKSREKDIVLAISKRLQKILLQRGYKVYMTRSKNNFIDLKNRTHYANIKKADLFISIHANALNDKSHHGIETYFLSPAKTARAKRAAAKENRASLINMDKISKNTLLSFQNRIKIQQSNKLAIDIQSNVLSRLKKKYKNVKDDGVKSGPFWVLVGAQMPAILLETGYITNRQEASNLKNSSYQNEIATGVADGIGNYFLKN